MRPRTGGFDPDWDVIYVARARPATPGADCAFLQPPPSRQDDAEFFKRAPIFERAVVLDELGGSCGPSFGLPRTTSGIIHAVLCEAEFWFFAL